MYCPECGDKNDEGATFCGNCGNPLTSSPSSMRAVPQQRYPPTQPSSLPQSSYPPTPPPPIQTNKSGVLGAVLNFLFPGLGYWYLGYRKVLGIHPVLFLIGIWIVEVVIFYLIPTLSLLSLLISLVVAYDAYVKAKGKPGWINAQ
jgi:hypothetical protein